MQLACMPEWHVHKDVCNNTALPGFVRHLEAQSPLVENAQSPGHGSWPGPVPRRQLHGPHRLVTAGGISGDRTRHLAV